MTQGLARRYGAGNLHFITCSCYRRLPLLRSPRSRDEFVKALGEMRTKFGFLLVGYVVMPEHVHLLISEPQDGTPSDVMRDLKQRVSLAIGGVRRRVIAPSRIRRIESEHRSFWQRRFYDFNVLSLQRKNEKLDYMHMNPVKRGLVGNPKDWPWSSYCYYMPAGNVLLAIDRIDE